MNDIVSDCIVIIFRIKTFMAYAYVLKCLRKVAKCNVDFKKL